MKFQSLEDLEKAVSEQSYRFETGKGTLEDYHKAVKNLEQYLYICVEEAKEGA